MKALIELILVLVGLVIAGCLALGALLAVLFLAGAMVGACIGGIAWAFMGVMP